MSLGHFKNGRNQPITPIQGSWMDTINKPTGSYVGLTRDLKDFQLSAHIKRDADAETEILSVERMTEKQFDDLGDTGTERYVRAWCDKSGYIFVDYSLERRST